MPADFSLRAVIAADARALRARMGAVGAFAYPSLLAVVLFRVSHALKAAGFGVPARLVMWVNQLLTGAELEPLAEVGPGLVLAHTQGVLIGMYVVAGRDLFLHSGVVLGSVTRDAEPRFPSLGDDVVVYAKATIAGPIRVGDGAVIGAHALVLRDVPDGGSARGPMSEPAVLPAH